MSLLFQLTKGFRGVDERCQTDDLGSSRDFAVIAEIWEDFIFYKLEGAKKWEYHSIWSAER
jgi:hypothetical protein